MKLLGRFRLGQALAIVTLLVTPVFADASPPDTTAIHPVPVPEITDGEDITAVQAGALALTRSPRLAVYDFERRIRDARTLQAALRPNPELAFEVENFAGSGDLSGFGGSELTLSVAQLFELGGKRSNRREVARFERELATWDYEAVRLEVLSDVSRAFVEVVAAQLRIALADDLIETAKQDLVAVGRRVEAGAASPIERTRARIALATAEMDRETVALALTAARVRLATTWGSDQPKYGRAVGDLEQAALHLPGVGERAPLVTEQLALEHRLGERRAVDPDERPARAARQLVERPRDELLARPGLATDQDRGAGARGHAHALEEPLHQGVRPEQGRRSHRLSFVSRAGAPPAPKTPGVVRVGR